ncbi:MAG: hypothetical protein QOH06_1331 [Acidobacteriota bacterium]|jgi:hypothetical protein|nr:hypothetical protein [Acidobacteriota bacterium]
MSDSPPGVEWSFFSVQRSGEVQYKQLPLPFSKDLEISVACGFRRSRDLDARDGRGQDYVAVHAGGGYVVGVLADGVSQSFFGDLAAREVAVPLADLLWERRAHPPDQETITRCLADLVEPVQETVQKQPLSVDPGSLKGQALERTRQTGTQTVFSAFIFHAPCGKLDVYQVGDTLVRVYSLDGSPELLPVNAGRWSSNGLHSLRLHYCHRTSVWGFLVHSDGLRKEWAERLKRPEVSNEAFQEEVEERVDVDDLSFVSVEYRQIRKAQRKSELVPQSDGSSGPESIDSESDSDRSSSLKSKAFLSQTGRLVATFLLGLGTGILLLLFLQQVKEVRTQSKKGENPSLRKSLEPSRTKPVQATVVPAEVSQNYFLTRYAGAIPEEMKAALSEGEILTRVSVRGISFNQVSVKGPKRTQGKTVATAPETVFFFRLPGRSESDRADASLDNAKGRWNRIELSLLNAKGATVWKDTVRLRGRQKKPGEGEASRFLGYHEIVVKRNGGGG